MSINISKYEIKQTADTVASGNSNWLLKEISFSKKLSTKRKYNFYTELGILLESGIDIKTALEIVSEQEKNKNIQAVYSKIMNQVIGGKSLSEAMRDAKMFSDYEIYSIKIGEESGLVITVLKDLAVYFDRKIEQKRKLISTFSYPVVVLFTAFAAVLFMMNFIVPMFNDLYKRFGGEIPEITKTILSISQFLTDNFLNIVLILLGIITSTYLFKKKIWYRKITSSIVLKIPLIGDLNRKIYLAQFFHSLHLLSQTKNPLITSIKLVRDMVKYYPLQNALTKIETDILHGKSLFQSMSENSLFDKKILALIRVAEETNKISFIFYQLNRHLKGEIEYKP